MAKRKVERRAGPPVAIRGAEDREESCEVLREFLRLAGGGRARLAIVSVASDVHDIAAPHLARHPFKIVAGERRRGRRFARRRPTAARGVGFGEVAFGALTLAAAGAGVLLGLWAGRVLNEERRGRR
ncbi:MAG TPA: hypothetical protein VF621_15275 [Pyrinomonadaceae bacterium]